EFVSTVAGASAAFMIVPRHVLGRGFQPPSDLVNVATVGFSGMGAENTRALMGQNVVAICDWDLDLLDGRLDRFIRTGEQGQPQKEAPPAPAAGGKGAGAQGAATEFRDFGPSKAQLAANARWPAQDEFANLQRFVEHQIPRLQKYQDYREMLDKQKNLDAIIVATPDHMHAVIPPTAMAVGKHVYVQKPLCWSVHEARHLARRAKEKKVFAQMGNQRHSGDENRRAGEYIQRGPVGTRHEDSVCT